MDVILIKVGYFLKGHNCDYALYHMIKSVLPYAELKRDLECELIIISSLFDDIVTTTIIFNDKEYQNELMLLKDENGGILLNNSVKLSFLKCVKMVKGLSISNTKWGILTGIRPVKLLSELYKTQKEPLKIFQERYQISDDKLKLSNDVVLKSSYAEKVLENGISLYFGIPICPSRCSYCSFLSAVQKDDIVERYFDALLKEIKQTSAIITKKGVKIKTVYIGGGTPSVLSHAQIAKLLFIIEQAFDLSQVIEFTFEAGRPDTLTREKLEAIKNSKVSRICINPQTLNNQTLIEIGRSHTAQDFFDAFYLARELGFHNINTDIIAGLASETIEDFLNTLGQILNLTPESITLHTLSLKRASKLHENYDLEYTFNKNTDKMIEIGYEKLYNSSYMPYYLYRQKNTGCNLENTGWARDNKLGFYNIYTMEELSTIIAFGAGAVTKVVLKEQNRIERYFNLKDLTSYISRIDELTYNKMKFLLENFE